MAMLTFLWFIKLMASVLIHWTSQEVNWLVKEVYPKRVLIYQSSIDPPSSTSLSIPLYHIAIDMIVLTNINNHC